MQNDILNAVETFYDCVGDAFDFEKAVQTYSTSTDDTGIALADVRPLSGVITFRGVHNIPMEAVEGWTPAPQKCPQREKLKHAMAKLPIHIPAMRRTFVPDKDWENSITYKRVSGPWGFHCDGTCIISKSILKITTCGFVRHPDQDALRADTLGAMAYMNKHLDRAISLQNRISHLEQTLIQTSNVLDLIEFGLVLFGPDKTPVFVNASARRFFDDADGMLLGSTGIQIRCKKTQDRFCALLNATYQEGVALSARSGGMLNVPRISRRMPYTLTIVPMRDSLVGADNVSAVAFIFDPTKKQTTTIKFFAKSYDLIRTEAELANSLMLGEKLDDVAQKRGVSYNTMKTHLHAIFAKTNTNRQAELVSLLLRSVAGLNLKN